MRCCPLSVPKQPLETYVNLHRWESQACGHALPWPNPGFSVAPNSVLEFDPIGVGSTYILKKAYRSRAGVHPHFSVTCEPTGLPCEFREHVHMCTRERQSTCNRLTDAREKGPFRQCCTATRWPVIASPQGHATKNYNTRRATRRWTPSRSAVQPRGEKRPKETRWETMRTTLPRSHAPLQGLNTNEASHVRMSHMTRTWPRTP